MGSVVVGRCHGGWTPEEGYVAIPANTTVYLFQDPGQKLSARVADAATLSTEQALQEMQSEAMWTLYPDDIVYDYGTEDLASTDQVWQGPLAEGLTLAGGGGAHLSDILREHKGNDIYWFACQAFDTVHDSGQELQDMLDQGKVKQV